MVAAKRKGEEDLELVREVFPLAVDAVSQLL
jgi:hypothetical protein